MLWLLAVQDLTCLIERYLEPLKDETYISSDDIEQLFGNIQEIVQFQRLFLHSLEDAVRSDHNFNCYDDNSHLTVSTLSSGKRLTHVLSWCESEVFFPSCILPLPAFYYRVPVHL